MAQETTQKTTQLPTLLAALLTALGCGGSPATLGPSAEQATAAQATAASATNSGPLPPPPAETPLRAQRPLRFPPVVSEQLPSGMQLVVVRATGHALASISLRVDVGGLADRPGVAELTAELVELGAGTVHAKLGEHERVLAQVGAELSAVHGPFSTSFELLVRRERLADGIRVMGGLLSRGQLRRAGFRALRARAMALADARSRDDAVWVGRELSRRVLFGGSATSRHATDGTLAELARIRHAHCDAFYTKNYRPEHAELVVVADVEPTAVKALAQKHFKSLLERKRPANKDKPTTPASAAAPDRPPSYLVDQHEAVASEVVLGMRMANGSPLAAKLLLVELLSQQLDARVALERGEGSDIVRIALGSDSDHTAARLLLAREQLAKLRGAEPASLAGAVERARRMLLVELLSELERADAVGRRVSALRARGMTNAELAGLLQRVQKTTVMDVGAALRATSAQTSLVVVGDAEALQPTLAPEPFERVDPRSGFSEAKRPKKRRHE